MKSFLQSVGVLKKDAEVVAETPQTSEQPIATAPVPKASLISANLQSVVATTQAAANSEVNPTIVENYVAAFNQELQVCAELSGLFMTLEAANKLARVADLRVRYQSALDVIGLAPENALQSADRYPSVLGNLVEKAKADIATESQPILAQHAEIHQKLSDEKIALMQRLNEVQVQLEENFQAQQGVISQQASFQASIDAAQKQMAKEFSDLHGILKSSIGQGV